MNMKKMLAVVATMALVAVAAPAFAENPFSDVPLNHWAYDAVEQLASRGILEGYPNGTFKGNRAMTRYEIAAMVARMMDADLSGADLDQLKTLVVEFKPELEALGVKVDSFDSRLSALERGVGGLRINGQLRFDGRLYDEPEDGGGNGDNGFQMNRARFFLHRDLSNGVSWDGRWNSDRFDRFYVTVKNFMGLDGLRFKAGQFPINPEADEDMYFYEGLPFMMNIPYRGIELQYEKGPLRIEGFVASNGPRNDISVYTSNASSDLYGSHIVYHFGEKGFIALHGLWSDDDQAVTDIDGNELTNGTNFDSYWGTLCFNIMNGLQLKGSYYIEDLADDVAAIAGDDSPTAYKIIIDAEQNVLKYTALWAEYAHFDAGFILHNTPYGYDTSLWPAEGQFALCDYITTGDEDIDVLFIHAKQQWTSKWSTFLRYTNFDGDTGDATEWGGGVGLQYSPNLYLELGVVDQDGRFESGGINEDYDNVLVRFRTWLNF